MYVDCVYRLINYRYKTIRSKIHVTMVSIDYEWNNISDLSSSLQRSLSHVSRIPVCSPDITVLLCYLLDCLDSVHLAMTGSNITHARVTKQPREWHNHTVSVSNLSKRNDMIQARSIVASFCVCTILWKETTFDQMFY